jgi:hypothetical protein
METQAHITYRIETDDPVAEIWATIKELAESDRWRLVFNRELAKLLPEQTTRTLEAAYDAQGNEVRLVVVNNPYLAEAVFQVRCGLDTYSSSVNPLLALADFRDLTTVTQ